MTGSQALKKIKKHMKLMLNMWFPRETLWETEYPTRKRLLAKVLMKIQKIYRYFYKPIGWARDNELITELNQSLKQK